MQLIPTAYRNRLSYTEEVALKLLAEGNTQCLVWFDSLCDKQKMAHHPGKPLLDTDKEALGMLAAGLVHVFKAERKGKKTYILFYIFMYIR